MQKLQLGSETIDSDLIFILQPLIPGFYKKFALFFVQSANPADHKRILIIHAKQEKPTGGDHEARRQHGLNDINNEHELSFLLLNF
jgi:hypothetical protein